MEIKKLDWQSFVSRRRLNVSAWIEHHNIKSYKALVEKCNTLNMEPPNKDKVAGLFKKKFSDIKAPIVEKIEEIPEEKIPEEIPELNEEVQKISKKFSKKKRAKKSKKAKQSQEAKLVDKLEENK
jgi:hypothetical protein